MKVWIEGDAGYPDGFAGGMISRDYPQLGMQAIVADARYTVAAGPDAQDPRAAGHPGHPRLQPRGWAATAVPVPADGQLQWTAPDPGTRSEIVFVRHVYRSSPTRYANRADGTDDKDSLYSLIDYLDPEATRTYLKLIHETYGKVVGDEFGKTDPRLPRRRARLHRLHPVDAQAPRDLQAIEGLRPPAVHRRSSSSPTSRRRCSAPRRTTGTCGAACSATISTSCRPTGAEAHGMEYMVHLNHEELMLDLAHRRGHGPQRGLVLPRHALRRRPRRRQPEPDRPGHRRRLPEARRLRRPRLRPPPGLGGGGREPRPGGQVHRRLQLRPRHEFPEHPRPERARRPRARPPAAQSRLHHGVVRQPLQLPPRHRPARRPGRALPPDRQHVARRQGGRRRDGQAGHRAHGAPDRLRPHRPGRAGLGLHASTAARCAT